MHYTSSHEWVTVQGPLATIGVTDYAQKELGEIVYIDLPKEGQIIAKGDVVCILESTKAAVDVYAPLSGKVTKVNALLREQPSFVNQEAEKLGWLFQIEWSALDEFDSLLDFSSYRELHVL